MALRLTNRRYFAPRLRLSWRFIMAALLAFTAIGAPAQRFYNLTYDQVLVEDPLPLFSYTYDLPANYGDSIYTVSIDYPEFIDVSPADTLALLGHDDIVLKEMPEVEYQYSVDRKKAKLSVAFTPFVRREGKLQKLVSFMLRLKSQPRFETAMAKSSGGATAKTQTMTRASEEETSRYASSSVLASGSWAKISVSESGVYQITSDLVKKAGFSDPSNVKLYGYGGKRQQEVLTGDFLTSTDDLKEVPLCLVGGKYLFYAQGPVSWDSTTVNTRTRNPYSSYGAYFITEGTPTTIDSETFLKQIYPSADYNHFLYEVDDYAWYDGGCNLFDSQPYTQGTSKTYTLSGVAGSGTITVSVTSDAIATVNVLLNGTDVGTVSISAPASYSVASQTTRTFNVSNIQASNTITLTMASGSGTVRLDYIALRTDNYKDAPDLANGSFKAPDYMYKITNQNHHADSCVDMVIIIPTTQEWVSQAERIAELHRTYDSLSVRIVPADELYNEFSSGTPDANAYRRYMKMLYDRAGDDEDKLPKYLLLFGDGVWDNRMLTSAWQNYDPDDFLLCYESENSFSEVSCYVDDGYFCYLDDGEGRNHLTTDRPDVAVGRFPVRTLEEATTVVDKTIDYRQAGHAGSWQTAVCILGDDGIVSDRSQNLHMKSAEVVAKLIENLRPELMVKRYMWDAYTRTSSSTGDSYPDLEKAIKQQMADGALVFNYSGHGAPASISHEYVLKIDDFNESSNMRLPLWVTASCDIMPFDGQTDNIGETAMLNSNGGAVCFYGTTRTVYASQNQTMNTTFTKYLFGTDKNGKRNSMGEAVRLAKNELVTRGTDRSANKLQYSLLGDPALVLAYPELDIVVDSINGAPVSGKVQMKAGTTANIRGHIVKDGVAYNDFNGSLTATVRDAEQLVVCRDNIGIGDDLFTFYDRPNTIYSGRDTIQSGRFSFTFPVPKDISYSDSMGCVNLYALSQSKETAAGYTEQVVFNGSAITSTDSIGPSIYCYLNSPSFVNGGKVNSTPYFVADLYDNDGINASGNSVGHDIELIIDGEMNRTYNLNSEFQYDYGTYKSGRVAYSIPELETGYHKLLFRAWDVLNNSSTAELEFYVVNGLTPDLISVSCTDNPAYSSTTFIVTHDRAGTDLDIEIDIFDMSGRQLHKLTTTKQSDTTTTTINWDLTCSTGAKLDTGVYLYRVKIGCEGSDKSSKANKLIVIRN